MTKKLLSMLVFVSFFAANMSAQETSRNAAPARQRTIMQVDDFIASVRANTSQRSANTEAARIKSLIKDSQPSVYFYSGTVKTYGDNPVELFTDVRSMNAIGRASDLPKNNIELVTIKVNSAEELNSGIDLSVFSDFPNVKYFFIQSNTVSSPTAIINGIRNNNPKYSVFYDLTKIN